MTEILPLPSERLCWTCDPSQFDFETTDEIADLDEIVGQARALDAIRFGVGIRQYGYNLYALGPPGTGKRTIVQQYLQQHASSESKPPDWCYVCNFAEPYKPKALELPAGRGAEFRDDIAALVEDLQTAIPAALKVEEHQNRVQQIENAAKQQHDEAFQELAEKALSRGIQLVRTPGGFAMAPVRDDEVYSPEEFEKLPPPEKEKIQASITALQAELRELLQRLPAWRKEARDKIKQLNREATQLAIGHLLEQVKKKHQDLPEVLSFLDEFEQDILQNSDEFGPDDEESTVIFGLHRPEPRSYRRYEINLLVDNSQVDGSPVVFEDHPNYQNLLGRIEHESQMGALVTDFTHVKPGALHRANGGYLVLEALRLMQQPFAWEGLKRAITSRRIKIESLAESLSLVTTVSLEPEPIPLDVKIVLLGERLIYYLLCQYDRDFAELFKVAADFEDEIERTSVNLRAYAQLVGTLVRREKGRPLDRAAVARVLEHSARMADDSERLTMHMRTVSDVLREADYWASQANADVVSAGHVQQAIDKQIHRVDRVRDRIQEEIQRGTLLIDTDGERIGQVNGLSVLDLGNFRFGRPARITATARLGKGEVIDIEREVELGGSIHAKGVLILSSFLASRFAKNHPLSLSASLVFEQSYGMVEGDSASVAELCALLSVLAEAPVRQSLAVTGSVNQLGQVQPIGGVNEKIEGFFDVCRQRGLTGAQGVLIPSANVKHLMLRHDVVQAAADGKFHVFAINTVDEAISLLTGLPAGQADDEGQYPPDSINFRVASRLFELFDLRRKYALPDITDKSDGPVR